MQKSVFLPKDDKGEIVHAHGGHILEYEGWYYWIGEDRTGHNKVSCYKSENLREWIFCNHILTIESQTGEHYVTTDKRMDVEGRIAAIGYGCNIERPKVIYCEKTEKFVMWMHWELPDDYCEARCAVAVCDKIDGDYTYLGSFNPIGHMSRDCTLFKDDDGTAYFISSARENMDLHIYRLTNDYLAIESLVKILWPGQQQEAPVLFKRNGYYIMFTSGCTGWSPNQSSYAWAKSIDGIWSSRKHLGDETTFRSQSTAIVECKEPEGRRKYWYLGDRWGGEGDKYFESQYVMLPLYFESDMELELLWLDEISV